MLSSTVEVSISPWSQEFYHTPNPYMFYTESYRHGKYEGFQRTQAVAYSLNEVNFVLVLNFPINLGA